MVNYIPGVLAVYINKTTKFLVRACLLPSPFVMTIYNSLPIEAEEIIIAEVLWSAIIFFLWNKFKKSGNSAISDKLIQ